MGQGSKRFFRIGLPPVIASFPIAGSPSLELCVNSFSLKAHSAPWCNGDFHRIRRDRLLHGGFNVTKRKAVRDKLSQRVAADIASHLSHAGAVASRLFPTDTKNPPALRTQMTEGAYGHFTEVREVAGLEEHPSQAQHLEAFGHRLRDACGLNHQVGATAPSQEPPQFRQRGRLRWGRLTFASPGQVPQSLPCLR